MSFRSVMALLLILVAASSRPDLAEAQQARSGRAFGVSAQGYPAGVILNARASFPVLDRSTLSAFAGYNVTDRRDFGEHDNEEGGGPGIGLAVRRYLNDRYDGFHYGVRADLWFMDIDWRDDAGPRAGSTDITVLQPTVQGGYDFSLGGGRFVLETTLAAGFEFNVRTDGEDVGEGPILLLGLGIAHR